MAKPLRVPPMAVMSAAVKSLVASLRVKVMVVASPVASTALGALTAMVGAPLSMVMGSVVGALAKPVGLVSMTLRLFRPWGSGLAGVAVQVPLAATRAVAMVLPAASLMAMVLPGVPVPDSVGVLSVVVLSPWVPLSLMAFRIAPGAAGATGTTALWMVSGSAVGALDRPAGLVSMALRLFRPKGSGLMGVAVQVPLAATRAVAMVLPAASLMAMVLPGVPVPDKVGVLSVVVLSPWVPVSLMAFRIAPGAAGATGAGVTGVHCRPKDQALLTSAPSLLKLPAASVNLSLATNSMALLAVGAGVNVAL